MLHEYFRGLTALNLQFLEILFICLEMAKTTIESTLLCCYNTPKRYRPIIFVCYTHKRRHSVCYDGNYCLHEKIQLQIRINWTLNITIFKVQLVRM